MVALGARSPERGEISNEVRAKEFILVDEHGKTRAILGQRKGTTFLGLFDQDGKPGLSMSVRQADPSIALFDGKGHRRGSLSLDSDGSPSYTLTGNDQKSTITLDISSGPSLRFSDSSGHSRVDLSLEEDGAPALTFYDQMEYAHANVKDLVGKTAEETERRTKGWIKARIQSIRARLHVSSGQPLLTLHDHKGKTRAVLGAVKLEGTRSGGVEQRPVSSLVLFDQKGQVMWQAP